MKVRQGGAEEEDVQTRDLVRVNTIETLKNYGELEEDILRIVQHMQEMYQSEVDENGKAAEAAWANVNAAILYVADAYDRMTAMKSLKSLPVR